MDTKQVIVIRKDLKMRRGKECSQCAHASMEFMVDKVVNNAHYIPTIIELQWMQTGYRKITLQVDTVEQLKEVYELAKSKGITSTIIEDSGTTEFHGIPTLTAVAIGPDYSDVIDEITGPEGLLPLKLY